MKKRIPNGLYVVVDPGMDGRHVVRQLERISGEQLSAIQIWDNPAVERPDVGLIRDIAQIFQPTHVPVLINNHVEILEKVELDGVHYDSVPDHFDAAGKSPNWIRGVTLTNDLTPLTRAKELGFDYVSFCSLFPSQTSNSCEIVRKETILACHDITRLPLFLSGGITPARMTELAGLPFNGVAVVSAVMRAEDPVAVVRHYQSILKTMKIITTSEIRNNSK